MKEIKNILFVCTGNTCRSAMAKGYAEDEIKKQNIDITIDSCGVSASSSSPASPHAIEALKEDGIDISSHISSRLTKEKGETADMIMVMTPSHVYYVTTEFPEFAEKTFLLDDEGISDPYGGDLETYIKSAKQIKKAVQSLMGKLKFEK